MEKAFETGNCPHGSVASACRLCVTEKMNDEAQVFLAEKPDALEILKESLPERPESALDRAANAPIFEGFTVPETPLAPKVAAESAIIIADAINLEREGILGSEQITEVLKEASSGNNAKAETLIILGKKESENDPEYSSAKLLEKMQREREQYNPAALVDELRTAFRRVGNNVIGRDELLIQTLYALLTREHQLVYSRAGMAKSLYASSVFGQFDGSRTFSMQLTKGTTEEGLVGAVNIDELKKGNIIHNVKGSLVDSRFAFLDEIFDANDVALRSMLGILNERLFRKGKQHVEAVLHTAIATSNYVRATEITEAIIDRFPFRAYLMPESDPYNLLRIDETYSKNTGRVVLPDASQKIPFEHVEYLADLVESKVSGREIQSPQHVLFLKNAVIFEFMKLVNAERGKTDRAELYISPRTMAKTRDILNASALLDGRTKLNTEDLNELKYMLCTIGDQEKQEDYFEQALKNVTEGIKESDLDAVDLFMEAHNMLEAILAKLEKGEEIKPNLVEKIKIFFNLTSIGELTFNKIRGGVSKLNPQHDMVNELKQSLLSRIDNEISRRSNVSNEKLF